MIFIKTLMAADQIYTNLMKLNINLLIRPNKNCKKTFHGHENKCFHFV